jgi:hypothetical protein
LICTECEVLEVIAVHLELLYGISHVKGGCAAIIFIEGTRIVFRNLVCTITAGHHSLITRHLVRLVTAVPCEIFAKGFAKHAPLVYAGRLAFEG